MYFLELLNKLLTKEDEKRRKDNEEALNKYKFRPFFPSKINISEYLDELVIPAFEFLEHELRSFSFRVSIIKTDNAARLIVREPDGSTIFKVALENDKSGLIQMVYRYGPKYTYKDRTEITFFSTPFDSENFRKIDGFGLIERFVRHFTIRRVHPEKIKKENENKQCPN